MRRKLIALAALGIALNAPGASAAYTAVQADCGFYSIAEENVTGGSDTFTGIAYGYAVSDTAGASISVTCEVRVNGGAVASTPLGPSGQASVTAGQVTYTAGDTDTVTLCAVWTGSESGDLCGATDNQPVPPHELMDLYTQLTFPAATLLADIANSLIWCVTAVNLGTCDSGVCIVNTGYCGGGVCLVNTGNCWRGCIAVVNTNDCGTPPATVGSGGPLL